ncbi:MAG: hypothetical protein ACQETQ_13690 [Spirochaetota bacterium]
MKHARFFLLPRRALRGYQRILTFSAGIFGVMAAAALISLAVVFPLWLTATRQPRLYTVAVLTISAAVLLLVLARSVRQHGIRRMVAPLRRAITVGGTVIVGYLILTLFATGRVLIGVPLALVFILVLGILAGWKHVGHTGEQGNNEGSR